MHLPRQSGPAPRAGRHVPARRALRLPPGKHPRQQDDLHLLSRHDVFGPCHAAVAAVHDLTRRGHARHRQLHPAHRHRRARLSSAVRARGQGHGPLRQGEILLPRGRHAGARRVDRLQHQIPRPRHAAAVRRRHVHHGRKPRHGGAVHRLIARLYARRTRRCVTECEDGHLHHAAHGACKHHRPAHHPGRRARADGGGTRQISELCRQLPLPV